MRKINILCSILSMALLVTACSTEDSGASPSESASTHTHTFSDDWSHDDTYHWHAATCEHTDVTKDHNTHSFGSWIVDIEPTETTEGSRHKECNVCSYVVNETIEKKKHVHVPGDPIKENIVDATCTESGTCELVTYCIECGKELSCYEHIIDAKGHDWKEPTYNWNVDFSKCTATCICKNDNNHIETETVSSYYQVIGASTCEDDKIGRYTASFTNSKFETQHRDFIIEPAHGHAYGEPQYEWSLDNATCTARRICSYDPSHIDGETVNTSFMVIDEPTVSEDGKGRFIATFTKTCFELQSNDIVLDATGSKDKLKFTLHNNSTYSVKALNDDIGGDVYIPAKHNGIPVTEVDYSGFSFCNDITSVFLGENIENIDTYSFYNCHSLETFEFNNAINKIGLGSFIGCNSLLEIVVPDSVTEMGDMVFSDCSSLKNVYLGSGIKYLDSNTLYGCDAIEELTIPFIGSGDSEDYLCWLFMGLMYQLNASYVPETLKKLTVLDSCSSIGNHALDGCQYLEELVLPFIGESATSNQYLGYIFGGESYSDNATVVPSSIKKVTLSNACNEIAANAFNGCTTLTSVKISEGVHSIGYRAFYGCALIESIVVPEGVTTIEDSAFGNMNQLVSVVLPSTLEHLGLSCFGNSKSLVSIKVSGDNNHYYSDTNDILYNKEKTRLICCPAAYVGSLIVPDSVKEIEEYAFYQCGEITSITLPSGLEVIENRSFGLCKKLTSITIPEKITVIDDYTFYGCAALTTINLPSNLEHIGNYAFTGNAATSINIPSKVTTIGACAFNIISNLENVHLPDGIVSLGEKAFSQCPSLTQINIPNSITSIGDYCFAYCTSLETITLSSGLKILPKATFLNCSSLSIITVPDGVEVIGIGAFLNCTSLEYISLPNSVTVIEGAVFEGCTALKEFTMPYYVVGVSEEMFKDCTSLASVELGMYDTGSVGRAAFANCTSLESITLIAITTVGEYAFYQCTSLQGIGFDDCLTSIENYALYNCTSLSYVVFSGTKTQWSSVSKGTGYKTGVPTTTVECSNGNASL